MGHSSSLLVVPGTRGCTHRNTGRDSMLHNASYRQGYTIEKEFCPYVCPIEMLILLTYLFAT